MFVVCCYGHVLALGESRFSPTPGDDNPGQIASLMFSILCRQRFAVSYADFARFDHPSRREPNAVSLGAVIFVMNRKKGLLVNGGSILRKQAQQYL